MTAPTAKYAHLPRPRWLAFVDRAGGEAKVANPGFDIISTLYGEPHRRYHTMEHIMWCLDLLFEFFPADKPDGTFSFTPEWFNEVELALWFHDVIYDPKRKDNEARSAAALKGFAILAGFPALTAEVAARDVLATTHTGEHLDGLLLPTRWVLDLDLASLGFSPEKFDENSAQIREEYAFVPEDAFMAGRKTVLQGFLDRPRLYLTTECHDRFEGQARDNLKRAIAALG